ncbi:putative Gag-Pol-like polyprotein/retrotransposon [Rhizoctonia solani 123E]|uniref:Putative Gag-Pol-like polyprotein/retrotransposon n=1 Tax=Rhizoctonia solani 123E TaxID=1423351 RepID=A0A074RHS4_9AGAM|nr:putative Gag-Pol-like polyprotein/retrotransposon [Rhizoctonia solani 123E]
MDVEAIGGYRYFITFCDDRTGLFRVYLLKKKSEALERYKEYKAWAEQSSGRKIRCLMSYRGGEFMSDAFECYLRNTGTVNQTSAPYTPEQNGRAERKNRDVMGITRAVLQDSNLAPRFWGEAVLFAAYVLNFRPNSALDGCIPYTEWTGRIPDVSHLRSFGCDAYVLIQPESRRTKTGPTATKCIFTGYTGSGYRCWDPNALRFRDSRHVVCVERTRDHKPLPPVPPPSESDIWDAFGYSSQNAPSSSNGAEAVIPTPRVIDLDDDFEPSVPLRDQDQGEQNDQDADRELDPEGEGEVEAEVEPAGANALPQGPRRSGRERRPNPNYAPRVAAFAVQSDRQIIPRTYQEAITSPNAPLWTAAIAKEFNVLLAKAVRDGLTLYAADFTAAFLNGKLQEEIYMEQPEGWSAPPEHQGSYLRLVRSLYGLKQAGRVWYECLMAALIELGFIRFNSDNCVFMRRRKDTGLILIAVHVDDLTGAAENDSAWNSFCGELNAKYELKNLGRAKEILGLEITQDVRAGTASITQTRYIKDLASRHDVCNLPPLSLPLPPKQRFSKAQCPSTEEEKAEMKKVPYLALVGALLFVCCQTRPDVSYAVCTLSRFSANPGRAHWDALLGILRYLHSTSTFGVSYSRAGSHALSIYSDADYGMCPDTYKSTTGWVVALCGGLVSWSSKLQSVIAQSTAEAEFIAMSMACREGYWVRSWLAELDGLPSDKRLPPTPLFCDNQAAIAISRNPESHQMAKHIAIRYHYVRDQVAQGEYAVHHVPSRDQTADFLTKPTSKEVFNHCRARAGIL